MSDIGLALYTTGLGLMGGFVGNIMAGWLHDVSKHEPSDQGKWCWIGGFCLFTAVIVIIGLWLGVP